MEISIKDLFTQIYQLLPGFVSAVIFYALTSYLKPNTFERIIQALIFTVIAKVLLIPEKWFVLKLGNIHSFGKWDSSSELANMLIIAIGIGFIFSVCINNDIPLKYLRNDFLHTLFNYNKFPFRLFRKSCITNKTLHPSEWYSFFEGDKAFPYVILHLEGERRLYGELIQFPDNPASGHFIIENPGWLSDTGEGKPLKGTCRILINAVEVIRIELVESLS
jgi:hypothetical protein